MRGLSSRVKKVKPSPTLAITARARAMKAKGVDVISLAAGEPDFDTPEHVKEGAIRALKEGFTKYTPSSGIPELKEAICEKLERENGLSYTPQEVIVTCGGKQALYNIALALFEEGDEVIIPAPYWVSYPAMVLLAGAEPVILETEESEGFRLTPEALRSAITARTKALILNTPSNPSGTAYTKDELEGIAEVALEHDLWIISDEVYEHIVFDGFKHLSIATLSPEVKERTIVVNALSKTYSMTGWRIGFAAGPREVIAAMDTIQSQSTSNPTSFAQRGALEALRGPQQCVKEMREEYQRRRDLLYELILSIPGISCFKPKGAFYLFPNFGAYIGDRFKDDGELCAFLLEEAHVATVPGSEFGKPGYLRLSFPLSPESLRKGAERIREALSRV
ncbi:MAG: aspartate aminotransferase [Deltaproteobacteria bacterium]|nr:MAG: aspartate aminotransferase [Deltaproteobacteria bacterium]